MPYKRFRKTLYKKVRGKWTKQKTYPSANTARKAMVRLSNLEKKRGKAR